MPDPARLALERALALGEQQQAALRAALAALATPAADDRLVPVKVAAHRWGISENAALKRAKGGLGEKLADGRWYFRGGVVEANRVQDQAG